MKSFTSLILCFFFLNASVLKATPPASETFQTVISVERYSDWQLNTFQFKIELDNHQVFTVDVSLNELIAQTFYPGLVVRLIDESFLSDDPGHSLFTYQEQERDVIFREIFPSKEDHWTPQASEPLAEVTKIRYERYGMSNFRHLISLSDGRILSFNYLIYPTGLFHVGDRFFSTGHYLVNVSNGNVINLHKPSESRWIKKTWESA